MNELFHTKCEKDYENHHYWESKGTVFIEGKIIEIFKCSQCQKCVKEELIFLEEKNKSEERRKRAIEKCVSKEKTQ